MKTDIIRGQATLQLVVSGSFCCHAVISSAVEDNRDSSSEYRGQHLGEVRGVKELSDAEENPESEIRI